LLATALSGATGGKCWHIRTPTSTGEIEISRVALMPRRITDLGLLFFHPIRDEEEERMYDLVIGLVTDNKDPVSDATPLSGEQFRRSMDCSEQGRE